MLYRSKDKLNSVAYVYRLTYLKAQADEPRYYIGVRSQWRSKTPFPWEDLGHRYFTSSPSVRSLFKANPDDFDQKIVGIFSRYKYAWLFEQRLLRRCGVPSNPLFFNQSVVTIDGVLTRTTILPLSSMNNLPIRAVEFTWPRVPRSIGLAAFKAAIVQQMQDIHRLRRRYWRSRW